MTTNERNAMQKSFDSVAFMREARARLTLKMNSMSSEDFRYWVRHHEYSDPRLANLAAEARPVGKCRGRSESEGA